MAASILDQKTENILSEMLQEACQSGASIKFKVISGSMSPLIEVGSVVEVGWADPLKIKTGDVVAFREGQNVVIHRFIGRERSGNGRIFRHRGDSGAFSASAGINHFIGKVTAVEKQGRRINLDSPRHFMSKRFMGWRLRIVDNLERAENKQAGARIRLAVRPAWRLLRFLLAGEYRREDNESRQDD